MVISHSEFFLFFSLPSPTAIRYPTLPPPLRSSSFVLPPPRRAYLLYFSFKPFMFQSCTVAVGSFNLSARITLCFYPHFLAFYPRSEYEATEIRRDSGLGNGASCLSSFFLLFTSLLSSRFVSSDVRTLSLSVLFYLLSRTL